MVKLGLNVFDVAVVGSGPAGSSAAFALAQGGAKVLLIDKASLPRYKTCGGGLVNRAWQLLPRSVAIPVERECHGAELNFLKNELHFATRRQEPIIFMTMRSALDHHLVLEAQHAGAQLEQGCAVKSIRDLGDAVEIESSKGRFQAKFVVAADGANSTVAKQGGWDDLPDLIPALECEVFVKEPHFARLSKRVRFDFELIPHGYAWVFPKKEHLSIGVLSARRGRVNLPEALGRYLGILGITQPEKIERHGYVVPIKPRGGILVRGRIVLTGDAAGLVDPVTAEGITYAIRSGQLAAQALTDGAFVPSNVVSRHQSLVGEEILPELKAGRILAWALYQQPRLMACLMRKHGTALSEFVTDVMMGRTTYRSALGKLGNYLRLLKLFAAVHPRILANLR